MTSPSPHVASPSPHVASPSPHVAKLERHFVTLLALGLSGPCALNLKIGLIPKVIVCTKYLSVADAVKVNGSLLCLDSSALCHTRRKLAQTFLSGLFVFSSHTVGDDVEGPLDKL